MIIGISGKKQSGKGVLSNWIIQYSNKLGIQGKVYSYASHLKEFCHKIMGLTYAQVYGTDDDKNTLTKYKWEDMPFYEALVFKEIVKSDWSGSEFKPFIFNRIYELAKQRVSSGFMTAREIMQTFGTQIGRKMYENIWTEALMRQIKEEEKFYKVQIIDDVRFINEADAVVLNKSNKLIRLTRKINNDNHSSETNLDDYTKFTNIIDNQNMTKEQFIEYLECNWI